MSEKRAQQQFMAHVRRTERWTKHIGTYMPRDTNPADLPDQSLRVIRDRIARNERKRAEYYAKHGDVA